jgi:hypothetical protein
MKCPIEFTIEHLMERPFYVRCSATCQQPDDELTVTEGSEIIEVVAKVRLNY